MRIESDRERDAALRELNVLVKAYARRTLTSEESRRMGELAQAIPEYLHRKRLEKRLFTGRSAEA